MEESVSTQFRLHVNALREALGVRCETCNYFGDNVCTIKDRWTTAEQWCMEWDRY